MSRLFRKVNKLLRQRSSGLTGIDNEFQKLSIIKMEPSRFYSANLNCNKYKNRLVNVLPYESTRVCLEPIRGQDGSDYINANYVDGYRLRNAYIATQAPLKATVDDFWRMVWEHNSTIIVMLTKLRENGQEKCEHYWPIERSQRYNNIMVHPIAEYSMTYHVVREFNVTDSRNGVSRTVRLFQYMDWPEQGVPKNSDGFLEFIGLVHKTKEGFGQDGPITVHCSGGVGRTGVFIGLSVILERLQYENVVDVFSTAKLMRSQRPQMIQSEEQYQFLYTAALDYLGTFDNNSILT